MKSFTLACDAISYSRKHPTEEVEHKMKCMTRDIGNINEKSVCHTCYFMNGKRHGMEYSVFNNGVVRDRCNYVNGEREGLHEVYYDNKQIRCSRFFVNGKVHGEYRFYNECGIIETNCFFVNYIHEKELNYLVNEPRDEAFYFTLALYGISPEHVLG